MYDCIRSMVFAAVIVGSGPLVQAAPVDVDGDGIVGPHEVIDLAENWKGPALQQGGVQPWLFNGNDIFFNAGKVGVGSATPHHQLRISGGPLWTSNGWSGSVELDNAAAIGWRPNQTGYSFGIGQTNGGMSFFRTFSEPGSAASAADYDLFISDAGRVGIGDSAFAPAFPLTIDTGYMGYGWVHSYFAIEGPIEIGSYIDSTGGWLGTRSNHPLRFFTNDSGARMTLTTDGRVEIGGGNTTTQTRLHAYNASAGQPAIWGEAASGNGVLGTSNGQAYGAVAGVNSSAGGYGIYGEANNGPSSRGVYGRADQGSGIYGEANVGAEAIGVHGTTVNGRGVYGFSQTGSGVHGVSQSGSGVYGIGTIGVEAVKGPGAGWALYVHGGGYSRFDDNVDVIGQLHVLGGFVNDKSNATLRIDHPLDMENKYLTHSSVESSEMKNFYDGTVITDDQGHATVALPEWFEAFNTDLRYQLTVIGQFAQAIVEEKIQQNRFTIRTDKPNVEVCWQVTGVRNDPSAKARPFEVEQLKPEGERGKYLDPEAYGQPMEKGLFKRGDLRVPSASTADSK